MPPEYERLEGATEQPVETARKQAVIPLRERRQHATARAHAMEAAKKEVEGLMRVRVYEIPYCALACAVPILWWYVQISQCESEQALFADRETSRALLCDCQKTPHWNRHSWGAGQLTVTLGLMPAVVGCDAWS